ncbi:hypothetical protein RJD24_05175 [Bacillaceae bacterium IKA-2]|nr:hypothetical protein RJD24_05175 [Bacillaceae bacterium IKA-2]
MVRHGEDTAKNENDMVVIVLFPLLLWLFGIIFIYLGWSVTNYLGDETPYSLGLCVLGAGIFILGSLNINSFIFIYLGILWLTGFIDDYFGTKFPKGLKGHLQLFIQTGKVSTGLIKLGSTVSVAAIFSFLFYNGLIIERLAAFILLVLGPHVMNLFDTRPLRVWKVIGVQAIAFLPLLLQLQVDFLLTLIFIIASLIIFEGKMLAMLGDNGATLLGGMINLLVVFYLSALLQWFVVAIYCLIIWVTERISLSEWIEKTPILKRIDRWGVQREYR